MSSSLNSRLERELDKELEALIQGATPGLRLQAFVAGRKKLDLSVGRTYKYYDWASLTKVVSTATILVHALSEKRFKSTNQEVSDLLPWFQGKTRITHHLNHSSGGIWWQPFYKSIPEGLDRTEKWSAIEHMLRNEKFQPTSNSTYSDVGYLVLGSVIERIFEKQIHNVFEEHVKPLGLEDTFYHLDNKPKYRKSSYAPTENCPWRGRVLQGEVHDENTFSLGGVAPHAGLFGPIEDLSQWFLSLRKVFKSQKVSGFKTSVLKSFFKRSLPAGKGDWGLGFMKPTPGNASCGQYFSADAVGHTGFTGTSAWWDPKNDLLVCILSNRVNPTRDNREFVALRPKIHDLVYERLVNQ